MLLGFCSNVREVGSTIGVHVTVGSKSASLISREYAVEDPLWWQVYRWRATFPVGDRRYYQHLVDERMGGGRPLLYNGAVHYILSGIALQEGLFQFLICFRSVFLEEGRSVEVSLYLGQSKVQVNGVVGKEVETATEDYKLRRSWVTCVV